MYSPIFVAILPNYDDKTKQKYMIFSIQIVTALSRQVNETDYSSPGTGTDASNSRNPTGGTSDGNKPGSGGQKLTPQEGVELDPAASPWSAMTQARSLFRTRMPPSHLATRIAACLCCCVVMAIFLLECLALGSSACSLPMAQ